MTESLSECLPASITVLERGWLSSNNVLLRGVDGCTLIDSGYISQVEQTLALLEQVLGDAPLDLLLNTHLHSDHCGGNAALKRRYDCAIAIPAADAETVRDWDEARLSFRATGQLCEPFGFEHTLTPGQTLTLGDLTWQVYGAPGHDPHALMLFCAEEGVLISGDALWENGFGVIFPELEGHSGFAEQRALLEQIAELAPRWVIPGHGAPFHGVEAALTRASERLAYLSADPRRNARHALKVLVMFKLLEQRRMSLDAFHAFAAASSIVQSCLRWLAPADADPLRTALDDLARSQTLRIDLDAGVLEA
jgi:glyoxylase-like metal-dependent hydrolase (beta-lactamase superfamily II)